MKSFFVNCLIYFALLAQIVKASSICTENSQCPFGYCDKDLKRCRCNFACDSFNTHSNNNYGCSGNTLFFVCIGAANVCESQQNVRFQRPTTLDDGQCNTANQEVETELEFCEEQEFCHFNGICLKNVFTQIRHCVCNDNFTGIRCESARLRSTRSILERIIAVSTNRPKKVHGPSGVSSSMPVISYSVPIVIVIACLAIFTCMFLICRKPNESTSDTTRTKNIFSKIEVTSSRGNKDDIITNVVMHNQN